MTPQTQITHVASAGSPHDTAEIVQDTAVQPEAPEALPNDTLAALHLLKSRFPAEANVTPFATKAQLYTVLTDRTTVDRQLEELRRSNTVRLLQLPAGKDEYAVMLTSDLLAALRRCKAAALKQQESQEGQQQQGMGPGPPGSQSNSAAAGAGVVFDWFATRVLPNCTEVMITHAELIKLLGGGRSRTGTGSSSGASSGGSSQVSDQHISMLLNHCFLTRHTGGPDGYLFSMPSAGPAIRSIAAGRQEIVSLLQRRRHPELLESELAQRKLQRSVLGARWHIADMVGGGVLLRIPTTVGPLLRVAKRGI